MKLVYSRVVVVTVLAYSALSTRADEPALPTGKPSAKSLRVAAVQMRSSLDLQENLESTRRHLARSAGDGARVVVFPECSVTGYHSEDVMKSFTAEHLAEAERQVALACRENKVYGIFGMPVREGDRLYNSAIVVDPTGKVLERYHKVQLAEAWPHEGDHLSVFKIDGIPCSIIICHDERYPELVRLPVLAGARVVFYVSHESGVRSEQKLDPYRAQIQARAVENSVYVVQANAPANNDTSGSHGQSRIITPTGTIMHEATIFGEDMIYATLDIDKATANFARRSVERGPLSDWWRDGVRRVRMIEE